MLVYTQWHHSCQILITSTSSSEKLFQHEKETYFRCRIMFIHHFDTFGSIIGIAVICSDSLIVLQEN